jgi:hypothetical protein
MDATTVGWMKTSVNIIIPVIFLNVTMHYDDALHR